MAENLKIKIKLNYAAIYYAGIRLEEFKGHVGDLKKCFEAKDVLKLTNEEIEKYKIGTKEAAISWDKSATESIKEIEMTAEIATFLKDYFNKIEWQPYAIVRDILKAFDLC